MYYFEIDKKLSHYIFLTTLGHAIVMIMVYFFGSYNTAELNISKRKLKIIQSSIKVDVVAMPKFTLKELKAMNSLDSDDSSSFEKADDVGGDEETALLKKANFLDKLKKLGQKTLHYKTEKTKKSKKKADRLKIDSGKLNKLILAGNKISKGQAVSGTLSSDNASKLQQYMERLPDIVKPYWKLPSFLKNKNLKCRIRVFISRQGKILKTEIVEPSGEEQFDSRALQALSQVEFPAPDKIIVKDVLKGVIILGFPL